MPNWCENVAIFTHDKPEMLERLAEAYNSGETMSRFFPCPTELQDTPAGGIAGDDAAKAAHEQRKRENIAKYGASDWYDWCCANWGVKWDFGYDENKDRKKASVGTRNGKPTLTLAFDTAWAPPFKFYEQMRDEYEYDIRAYYSELGVGFVGSLHNGVENTISIEEFTQEWLEDNVPAKICALFNLYEQAAEIEELNKEAENEAE